MKLLRQIGVCGVVAMGTALARGETGAEAWLRYAPLPDAERVKYASLPAGVVVLGDSPLLRSAQQEMIRGVKGMLGTTLREAGTQVQEGSFVLGTVADIRAIAPELNGPHEVRADGFWLTKSKVRGFDCLILAGATDRGVLYGVFSFLSSLPPDDHALTPNFVAQPSPPIL